MGLPVGRQWCALTASVCPSSHSTWAPAPLDLMDRCALPMGWVWLHTGLMICSLMWKHQHNRAEARLQTALNETETTVFTVTVSSLCPSESAAKYYIPHCLYWFLCANKRRHSCLLLCPDLIAVCACKDTSCSLERQSVTHDILCFYSWPMFLKTVHAAVDMKCSRMHPRKEKCK